MILVAGKDGGLWIGTANGLAHWDNKNLISIEGYEFVQSISEDPDGSVWFTHSGSPRGVKEPLCHLAGNTVKCYGEQDGIPPGDILAAARMAVGARHEFWLGTGRSILRGTPGSFSRFAPLGLASGEPQGPMAIVPLADGSAWVGIGDAGPGLGLEMLTDGRWKATVFPGFDSSKLVIRRLLLDREGGLWIGTADSGLYRIHNGRVDHFGVEDGLSGDDVMCLYEDHEGSIWVATTNGLDRFHDLPVVTFSGREGLDAATVEGVMASRDGTVRVGNKGSLVSLRQGQVSSAETIKDLPGNQVTSTLEDHAGRLWIGIDSGLFIYETGKFTRITWPDGRSFGRAFGIAEDERNDIWLQHRGSPYGLIRIRDGRVIETLVPPAVPDARELAADPKGGIWLGPRDGGLAHYQNGKLETYPASPGPDHYGARQIAVTPEGFTFGALGIGLMAVRDGKAQVLSTRNGLPCDSTNGVVPDGRGHVWLYSECGLTSIAMSDIQKWWGRPDLVINVRTLDALDGVRPGRAPFQVSARSTDGKLWFANDLVLQMVDPAGPVVNSIPPPVQIEAVKADGKVYSVLQDLRLPALTRDLEFDYTALSLVMPQRARFRYRLEGYDTDWKDAGTRRSAFYTNLSPNKYTFRVIACNNDGIWNEKGAALIFTLQPAFFQTAWFNALCAVFLILFIWVLYRLRVQIATERVRVRLSVQLAERERIARDLHDVLGHTLSVIVLKAELAGRLMGRDDVRAAAEIADVEKTARTALAEVREAIGGYRAQGLGAEVEQARRTLDAAGVSLVCDSAPPQLKAREETVLSLAVREAVTNIVRHAHATTCTMRFSTTPDGFCALEVLDNGTHGITREGNGLRGMRERVQELGGRFRIDASDGTKLVLEVPFEGQLQVRPDAGRAPVCGVLDVSHVSGGA